LARFHFGIKRFINPHQYPVGLEEGLHELKTDLVLKARGFKS
jgi:nicotinate phosphoribosyltransferase